MLTAERSTPERGKHDKECRQRALLDAANTVFAERGYDAATTREIASRAGCAEGLIHRYFSGKHGLLLAILESKGSQIRDDLPSVLPDRDSVREELEQLLLWYWEAFWQRRDYMRVSISRAMIDPEVGHAIAHRINDAHVELITGKLRRHQAAGRIRQDAGLQAVAYSISALGFAIGFVFQSCFGESREKARHILLTAADTITRGLVPAPEPPP
ncbi:MAG: TetR/AcrR family transcriptional regulator [Dehalococcoidia bacterium]|nr:TetR/AcrR family transcriptional regulator [Dehalococcoidia bacterium]